MGEPMCSPFYGEEQFMSYGKFERIEQVSDQFEIKVKRAFFIDVMDIEVDEFFLVRMGRALLKKVLNTLNWLFKKASEQIQFT
jgi:hypothetical protein